MAVKNKDINIPAKEKISLDMDRSYPDSQDKQQKVSIEHAASNTSLKVEHLLFGKLSICNGLQIQPYATILCGFREGRSVINVFLAE